LRTNTSAPWDAFKTTHTSSMHSRQRTHPRTQAHSQHNVGASALEPESGFWRSSADSDSFHECPNEFACEGLLCVACVCVCCSSLGLCYTHAHTLTINTQNVSLLFLRVDVFYVLCLLAQEIEHTATSANSHTTQTYIGGENSTCTPGYEGPLCSACSSGFASLGTKCIDCPVKYVRYVLSKFVYVVCMWSAFIFPCAFLSCFVCYPAPTRLLASTRCGYTIAVVRL